jgi:hypothetical protein
MRTKKRAQLRETKRRERSSQGSAYENEPPLEETKTSHDTSSALDNNTLIHMLDEAGHANASTNDQAHTSVIHHTQYEHNHHEPPLTSTLQDIPGEEVKAEPVREEGTCDASSSMTTTSVKRPHKESSSMITSKPKGKQPVEEEKEVPLEFMRAGKVSNNTDDGHDIL